MAGSAAAVAAPMVIPSSALGLDGAVPPSERIRVAGIGIGRRGEYDLGCFLQQPDVQFVAVCDVKQARRDAVKAIADKHHGTAECRTYHDFRELLDQPDVDAVLIATGPDRKSVV
jgi:predicted dehydrogenase